MEYTPQCLWCLRLRPNVAVAEPAVYACDAFPTGIPEAIIENAFEHTRAFPGDHGLLYLPEAGAPAHPIEAMSQRT